VDGARSEERVQTQRSTGDSIAANGAGSLQYPSVAVSRDSSHRGAMRCSSSAPCVNTLGPAELGMLPGANMAQLMALLQVCVACG
jgi:hypothetical protein